MKLSVFLHFLSLLILCFSAIIFYFALRNYLDYAQAGGFGTLQTILASKRIEDALSQDKQTLDTQTSTCQETILKIQEDQITPEFVAIYTDIQQRIVQFNVSCHQEIDQMSQILMQIINMTNATSRSIQTGTCQFNPANGTFTTTSTVAFDYRLLELNGLDFYYYVFGQSSDPITVMDDEGARIENCSPIIFDSTALGTKPLYTGNLGGGEIRMGKQRVEIRGPFANQTLQIEEGLQLWLNVY